MIEKIFYWPGDYLGGRLNARQRRAVATWSLIGIIVTIPLRYPFRNYVSLVWAISELALVLNLWGVVSAETPVEKETEVSD